MLSISFILSLVCLMASSSSSSTQANELSRLKCGALSLEETSDTFTRQLKARLFNKLGDRFRTSCEFDKALVCFELACAQASRDDVARVTYLLNWAKVLCKFERFDESLAVVDELLALEPLNSEARFVQSHIGEHLNQQHAHELNSQGVAHLAANNYTLALGIFEQAVLYLPARAPPQTRSVYIANQAVCLLHMAEYERALERSAQAMRLDAHNQLAKEVRTSAERLVKRRCAGDLNANGVELLAERNALAALECFRRAAAESPVDDRFAISTFLANAARALCLLRDYGQALAQATRALSLDADNPVAKRQLQLAQQGHQIQIALEHFYCGDEHCRAHDYRQALKCFHVAVDLLSRVNVVDDELDENEGETVRQTLVFTESKILAHTAQTLNKLRKHNEALVKSKAALDLNPNNQMAKEQRSEAERALLSSPKWSLDWLLG